MLWLMCSKKSDQEPSITAFISCETSNFRVHYTSVLNYHVHHKLYNNNSSSLFDDVEMLFILANHSKAAFHGHKGVRFDVIRCEIWLT